MRFVIGVCLGLLVVTPVALPKPDKGDVNTDAGWPQWRGPGRDAVSAEKGLLKQWPATGPKLVWDSRKINGGGTVGSGYSSMAITQGKIFTLGDAKGQANVYCLDAETGKELWKVKVGPADGDNGPRCTPTVDGERLYVLTRRGGLACLKAGDGAVVWTKDFAKDFNAPSRGWGFCESLLVDGEKLLCSPGSKNALMVALNKLTGEVIWQCKVPDKINTEQGNGYSSIVIAEVGGVKQYINLFCTGVGLAGVEAKTGKLLWNYRKVSNGTAAIPTAIVKDDYVFASSGYNTGAVLLKLVPDGKGGIDAKEEYFLNGGKLQNHHGGMIMVGDHIYGGNGHDNGQPFCLEWKTGKVAWLEKRGAGGGSAAVVFADGHLYFRYQDGRMALIEATPKEYNLKSSFNVPLSNPGWQHPVIYHGRLYLRGNDQILCYDIKQ